MLGKAQIIYQQWKHQQQSCQESEAEGYGGALPKNIYCDKQIPHVQAKLQKEPHAALPSTAMKQTPMLDQTCRQC